MRPPRQPSWFTALAAPALLLATPLMATPPMAHANEQHQALVRLLSEGQCPGCNLQDADLVHADLRGANLRNAQLQRANLSQARLEGANLQGANLSFTSLQGAYLQGANLLGATLEGTDLRQADLSGSALSPGALSRTHWSQTKGIKYQSLSYSELHNGGVDAAQAGRFIDAERLFGEAIRLQPNAPVSWIARGLSRVEVGNIEGATRDLAYSASLLASQGELEQAALITQIAEKTAESQKEAQASGNGMGSALIKGTAGLARLLLPLATKMFTFLP